jgi:hypothetical protein
VLQLRLGAGTRSGLRDKLDVVQFDYHLIPANNPFTDEELDAMRESLGQLIIHAWNDVDFTVFPTAEYRALRLPNLLNSPDEPDWLNGYVRLAADRIVLGILQDDDIRHQIHTFASGVIQRRPDVQVMYGNQLKSLSELLP